MRTPPKLPLKSLVLNKKEMFKRFVLKKKFPKKPPRLTERDLGTHQGWFSQKKVTRSRTNFELARFFSRVLPFPVEVRLKNIFSLKAKQGFCFKSNLLMLSRKIYKNAGHF